MSGKVGDVSVEISAVQLTHTELWCIFEHLEIETF